MKETFWDNSIKKSIIASIIASIMFIILIEPIFKLVFNLLTEIADNFYTGLVDMYYKNAALGETNAMDFLQLFILFGLIFLVNIFMIFESKRMIKDSMKTLSEEKDDINTMDKKELENKLREAEIKLSQIKVSLSKNIKGMKYLRKVFIGGSIFFTMVYLYFLSIFYISLQLNTSFQQRLTILRPHITETETYIMQAKWALMKSRINFIEINKQMDSVATKRKIQLPELLLN